VALFDFPTDIRELFPHRVPFPTKASGDRRERWRLIFYQHGLQSGEQLGGLPPTVRFVIRQYRRTEFREQLISADGSTKLARVPLAGGAPREVIENVDLRRLVTRWRKPGYRAHNRGQISVGISDRKSVVRNDRIYRQSACLAERREDRLS